MRNLEDAPSPKKKINWDKIIYFAVLFIILFTFFRYFFVKAVYVEAQGQVMFENLKIRLPEDVTLQEFLKREGDTIKRGDTLFRYYYPASFGDGNGGSAVAVTMNGGIKGSPDWIEREIYQLHKNIELNNLKYSENKQLLDWLATQIKQLEEQVILEISSKNKIESYKKEIEKTKVENVRLMQQNGTYKRLISSLKERTYEGKPTTGTVKANSNGGGIGYNHKIVDAFQTQLANLYISPIEGVITRIYKNNYEVALKSENIINVHRDTNIYIKAFFDQTDLEHLAVGTQIDVEFPDGSESIGLIKRFYYATYRVPEEFQKKYESTTRSIAADVVPLDSTQAKLWHPFYKMEVKLSKNKW